jgi:hypothetical protein
MVRRRRINFIVNPAGGGTINPTLHYHRTHYSTIPAFQHSNRTTLRLSTGWGEAPKFLIAATSGNRNHWTRRIQDHILGRGAEYEFADL